MTSSGKLFLVEGLDLAGKTSVCKSLVAWLMPRPEHCRNALASKNILYLAADELRRADELDGRYLGHAYLAAAALDMKLFRPPLVVRIQESTIALRSLCHYRARFEDQLADGFGHILDDPDYPRFDAAVVLTASLEERRARLDTRQREAPNDVAPDDLAVIRTPDLFRRMESILVEEAVERYGATVIDTSGLDKVEVVDAVAAVFTSVIELHRAKLLKIRP